VRLLSDYSPVARIYGLFWEKDGFSKRVTVVLDKKVK